MTNIDIALTGLAFALITWTPLKMFFRTKPIFIVGLSIAMVCQFITL